MQFSHHCYGVSSLIKKYQRCFVVISILGAAIGSLLFGKGFLQVRKLIEEHSTCEAPPVKPLFYPPIQGGCWLKPLGLTLNESSEKTNERIILIVIDALRLDFILPSLPGGQANLENAWYDKLTIPVELRLKYPESTQLFHFVADPPTATTQRLAGLTSGTLPAFVEIAANFAENSLGSDNLVKQWLQRGLVVDVLGDDTWLHLFPSLQTQPAKNKALIAGYHSFHLFDLDTVDNAIEKHIFPHLENEHHNHDILIAHFLGLDHCGHKFGAAHVQCGEKLGGLDRIIRRVIDMMDVDTRLIIIGDHGMTDNGDHGGISEREITTALFSYKKRMTADKQVDGEFWQKFFADFNEKRKIGNSIGAGYFFEDTSDVSIMNGAAPQLDFAATLSFLTDVPIPWGNVGAPLPEMLINWDLYHHKPRQEARLANLRYLLDVFRQNAHQVQRLLLRLGEEEQNGFSKGDITPLLHHLHSIHEQSFGDESTLVRGILDYYEFLLLAQQHCRRIWADFDVISIFSGLALGLVCIIAPGLYFLFWMSNNSESVFAIVLATFHSIALAATSFITFEDSFTRFLLASLLAYGGMMRFVCGHQTWKGFIKLAISMAAIRVMAWSGACREEQYPYCTAIGHRAIRIALTPQFIIVASVGALGIFGAWKRCQHGISKLSRRTLLANIIYSALLVLVSIHWTWTWFFDTTEGANHDLPVAIGSLISVILPRLLYLLSFVSGCLFSNQPSLFATSIAVFLGTVSRPFSGWMLLVPGLTLLFWGQSMFASRHETAAHSLAIYYYLVASLLFFVTGHQWTLTNLQWEAAFIGIRSTVQTIAGALVVLNTFSGPILAFSMALMVDKSNEIVGCFLWYSAMQTILLAVFTTTLMRHLQVWKMFTPRFVLQAAQNLLLLAIYGVITVIRLLKKHSSTRLQKLRHNH